MRNVGGMGEKTLGLWADQVGITANKVSQDCTGWDFILEFPRSHEATLYNGQPLDRFPFPLQCFVQVKSTDKRRRKCRAKLDNWERLVKNPLPAFFLILEFDSQNCCQHAFLVHIGEEHIRRVQQRLREHGKNPRIHKKAMQIKYNQNDALPSRDGKGLKEAILRHVGDRPEEYAAKKIHLAESVGYENETGTFNFSARIPSGANIQEYLTDFLIGLVPHLDVTSGEFRDVRFGIASPDPTMSFSEGGKLSVERKSAGPSTVRISTPDEKAEMRIDAETYLPQGFGFEISRDYVKMRLAAPFLNITLQPYRKGDGIFHFSLPRPDVEYELKEIHTVADFLVFLHEASQRHDHVRFEVRFNSALWGNGTIRLANRLDQEIIKYAASISRAWKLARYFDVPQGVRVKASELLRQYEQLILMEIISSATDRWIKLSFWSDPDLPQDRGIFCVPITAHAVIGQYRIVVAGAVLGRPAPTGQSTGEDRQFEITTTDVKLCRQHLYDRSEGLRYTKHELINAVIQEHEGSAHILTIDNF